MSKPSRREIRLALYFSQEVSFFAPSERRFLRQTIRYAREIPRDKEPSLRRSLSELYKEALLTRSDDCHLTRLLNDGSQREIAAAGKQMRAHAANVCSIAGEIAEMLDKRSATREQVIRELLSRLEY